MKWIGLTGGIASGKTTISNLIRTLGYIVIDADQVAHEISSQNETLKILEKAFGPSILNSSDTTPKTLNRKKLAELVFQDSKKLLTLESILHPRIQDFVNMEKLKLEKAGHLLAFYDVPLLFEKNLHSNFDFTILVYCTEAEQRDRLKTRNQFTENEIDLRLKSQLPIDEKKKLADFIILNHNRQNNIKEQINTVIKKIKGHSK